MYLLLIDGGRYSMVVKSNKMYFSSGLLDYSDCVTGLGIYIIMMDEKDEIKL